MQRSSRGNRSSLIPDTACWMLGLWGLVHSKVITTARLFSTSIRVYTRSAA